MGNLSTSNSAIERKGVVGLDLSLSRAGICFIPGEWDGSIGSLVLDSVSAKKANLAFGRPDRKAAEEIGRYLRISKRIVDFIKKVGTEKVAVEGYAFSQKTASVTKLAELRGAVSTQIYLSCNCAVSVPVPPNTARKFLMGSLERKNQKDQVRVFLRERRFVFDNDDLMDAFVVAYCYYGFVNRVRSRFVPQVEMEL